MKHEEMQLGCEAIDLTAFLGIDDFDRVVRAVQSVIAQSASLSLDAADDREALKGRLLKALGCVVEPGILRLDVPQRAPLEVATESTLQAP